MGFHGESVADFKEILEDSTVFKDMLTVGELSDKVSRIFVKAIPAGLETEVGVTTSR